MNFAEVSYNIAILESEIIYFCLRSNFREQTTLSSSYQICLISALYAVCRGRKCYSFKHKKEDTRKKQLVLKRADVTLNTGK